MLIPLGVIGSMILLLRGRCACFVWSDERSAGFHLRRPRALYRALVTPRMGGYSVGFSPLRRRVPLSQSADELFGGVGLDWAAGPTRGGACDLQRRERRS